MTDAVGEAGLAPEPLAPIAPSRGGGLVVRDAVVVRDVFRLEVDIEVGRGQSLAILGPNGAGKTTLLRTLAGLTPLTSGSMTLDDQVLDDGHDRFVPAEARQVGLVFQGYRLFPHLKVRENVAFGPRSRGCGRARSRQVADLWIDRLRLTDLAGRRPDQLSGGQAQRVALARALATDPSLLLLDEPLAAMDARTRLEVRTTLREHLRQFDGPVIVVTHDPLEAMVMADRLLVLEGGRVVQVGTPTEVARRPVTDYVARLVGLNLYAGRVSDGQVALDQGGRLVVAGHEHHGERVLVAIRPASVGVHARQPVQASPRNVWAGTVAGLEPLGDRVRVQVEGDPDVLVDVTPAAVADLALRPGRSVWVSVKATDLEVYPESLAAG